MRIKTRLQLGIILSLVLAAMIALLLFLGTRAVNEASREAGIADQVVKGVAELKIVTHEYVLHPEERSLMQWRSRYNFLSEIFTEGHFKSPDEKIVADQIFKDLERFKIVFSALATGLRKGEALDKHEGTHFRELQDRLMGDLLVKSQLAISLAFQLQQKIEAKLVTTQRRVSLLTVLLLLTLTAAIIGILLWVNRSIGGPIAKLEKDTRIIGSGNLDHKAGTTAKDEIGQLSRAFDKMTQDLKETTTSIVELNKEIDERKQAEEALRESEERFRTFIDFTYDWEFWIAPDGHHVYVSPSCERITGYGPDEFVNDPGLLVKIVHPDDHSTVVKHLGEEQSLEKLPSLEFRIIARSGEERWINHNCQAVYGADGAFLGRRGSNRDISKRKQMEEEFLKAKKLESLGVLAGGIAHDFNNLLTSVVGNISLAKMEIKPGSKAFRNLVEAEKASIQTKELTARLITFSKGGEPVKETISIGNLIKDSVDSLLKGSDIDARFSIPDDISPVEVDEEQMKQVIHNIITNAQEAMAGQGTINVSCENIDIGVKDTLTLKNGKYVKISIEDQGPGMPGKDLANIFDPYFSTKDMGTQKGMGLGLAVSDSIIKKHDGLITVESELGTGTTFSIYLPAASAESQAPSTKRLEVDSQSTIVNHSRFQRDLRSAPTIQRILVMDDEDVVRDVSNALLTHIGYEVEVAVDGVEAIEMYRKAMESEKPFDMVILDLTNKFGMGGAETIVRLLEIDPDVKAIVATGYSNDPIMSKFREHGFRGALPKPFTIDQLRTALHDAIAG